MTRKTTGRKDEQNRTHKTELSLKQRKLKDYKRCDRAILKNA